MGELKNRFDGILNVCFLMQLAIHVGRNHGDALIDQDVRKLDRLLRSAENGFQAIGAALFDFFDGAFEIGFEIASLSSVEGKPRVNICCEHFRCIGNLRIDFLGH